MRVEVPQHFAVCGILHGLPVVVEASCWCSLCIFPFLLSFVETGACRGGNASLLLSLSSNTLILSVAHASAETCD